MTAKNLTGSLVGVALRAVLVNVVRLLCTAGLPAIFTQILTLRKLGTIEYYGHIALDNMAYLMSE